MKKNFKPSYSTIILATCWEERQELVRLSKWVVGVFILLLSATGLNAQSGGWDASGTNGATGFMDHGSGVIQLMGNTTTGCAGAAIHETTSKYDPTVDGVFNKCYQVFFGCPGNDDIGSDTKGDGMAFSFSKCAYNINNGNSCGGGLGYMGSCSQMITVEFDTWSSQGSANFDNIYQGTGNNDQVAIHRDGDASFNGYITGANPGNLEDGLEHTVCINYNPTTHLMVVSIDGNSVLTYNFTGSPYDLQTYFGAGGLNQTWSSGKFGATNPATVSNGASITGTLGGLPLCPANIVITSPSSVSVVDICNGPITITASATPPASNTISFVEFFVDGLSIGVDNTANYAITWNSVSNGDHAITAVAHYSPSNTTSTSSASTITVSPGIQETLSAPTIDGTAEIAWGNYATSSLDEIPVGTISGPSDLSATYQTMRDANNLYILVEVTDDNLWNDGGPNPWDNDGVEVFIDMGNDKNTSYGVDDFQYAFVYNDAVTVTEYKHNAITGVTFSQGVKAGGYIMEISIPWTTLGGAPIDGELIGFDLHINEDDGGGARDAKIAWNDAADIAFNNPTGFGTIIAAGCNPCPTGIVSGNNMVCDGMTTSPLSVSFTGNGPWSFTYTIDGLSQPAITNINTSPYVFQSATGAHVYTLTSVSNATTSGCTGNASGTAIITLATIPVVHDGIFMPPGSATLSVDNTGGTYEWYDAPIGGNLVFTGPIFNTPVLTIALTYYVQEASGAPCRIEVRAIPITTTPEAFLIPNLITPNSDGKNDQFEILGLPVGSALNVFNRWGDRVYQSSDYDNLWAGSNYSDGVYYFDLMLPDGKQYKGWLNIVR